MKKIKKMIVGTVLSVLAIGTFVTSASALPLCYYCNNGGIYDTDTTTSTQSHPDKCTEHENCMITEWYENVYVVIKCTNCGSHTEKSFNWIKDTHSNPN
ncbi:hypothetical protein [Oceanirhabdus sp. W0125-5]|uniref:hypothetical protein n=1 Tax=Oceanirhabdus sp. W0125-5 TaxID=2999116 RepID=UPI0022F2F75D|nr:hypothetical protein [Oceanirhabdus sp. W0125-5]WBW96065.1 hypothetical protein OW730_20575 [Oceanirhabdus sp. W0125-5]